MCDYMQNDCGLASNVTPTLNSAVWVPIANNIVSLRGQYGLDTNAGVMNGIVDTYNQTTPTTACGWIRASTLRMVLVARNGQPNKTNVTTSTSPNLPTWAGSTANNPAGFTSSVNAITLSSITVPSGFTWQNYRYKAFETTVPIQNVQFLGVQAGC
jgi:type IV pilus assembly protein PilW